MDYFRHKKGNGKIYGLAEVCRQSYLDRTSSVRGENISVWNSQLFNSEISESGIDVISSILNDSIVRSAYQRIGGHLQIAQSTAQRSEFYGSVRVLGAFVDNSIIKDSAQIRGFYSDRENATGAGGARVVDSLVKDRAVICGNASVESITVDREMRIGAGFWQGRAPRYTEIRNDELGILSGVTESIDGFAYIGCTPKPMAVWLRKARSWGKVAGWTGSMISDLYFTFQEWLDVP